MDYSIAKFWFDIFQTLIIAAIGIQQWLYRRQSATISGINRIEDNLSKEITMQQSRLIRLEENIKNSPTHNDLGKIYDKLNELTGSFNKLVGEFTQVSKSITRLYDNELSKK